MLSDAASYHHHRPWQLGFVSFKRLGRWLKPTNSAENISESRRCQLISSILKSCATTLGLNKAILLLICLCLICVPILQAQAIRELQSASTADSGPLFFPFANTFGSMILVVVASGNAPTYISDTLNNLYQLVPGSSTGGINAYIASNVAAGRNAVTVNGITTWSDVYIHEYAGLDSSSPIDQVATATGTAITMATGAKTTTFPYELIFGFAFAGSSATGPGTGFNSRESADGNLSYDETVTSMGTYSAPATQKSSSSYTALMITLKGATSSPPANQLVNATTYHYDNARTGQNTNETVLTPTNVNSSGFGRLFSVSVDGNIYAQPLYLANVNIAGGIHNVVYVATEHDSIYAIDADNGTLYWKVSLIPSGGTTVPYQDIACDVIKPEIGITSTPVIDSSTGTIYAVTKAKVNGNEVQHLHAIDTVTGGEKLGAPVLIQASVAGNGDGGTTVSFSAFYHLNRSGLLLQNGHVLIAWASHCDITPYHGWLMSYSASTLAQEAVFNTTPNGTQGGVWMSGAAPAGDANFNTYFGTGNGTFDGNTNFGDSIVEVGEPSNGAFQQLDFFTPANQSSLNGGDVDLGSGGVLLLPDLPIGSPHQHLLVQVGKEGKIYLIDRDQLGGFCSTCTSIDTQIVQELPNAVAGMWGTPAYWNGHVYFCGAGEGSSGDTLKEFSFDAAGSGLLSTSPTSTSATIYGYPGSTPTVSASGNNNGIVWTLQTDAYKSGGSAILHAYDATKLAKELYNSNQNAARDNPGAAVKFTVPIVANGKVYVGTSAQLSVFGLLGNSLAAPTNLTATAGNGQIMLTWSTTLGATSYNVKRSTITGGPYTTVASPTSTSFTDGGLTNGTTYYYVVSAVSAGGESPNSNQVSATPQAAPPTIREVQSSSATTAGPVAFPFSNTAGSTILVTIASGNPPTSVSDTQGNHYQLVPGSSSGKVIAYLASNVKAGSNAITVNGVTTWADTYIHEYAGISLTSPIDQVAVASGTGTAVTAGSRKTVVPVELIFGFAFVGSHVTAVGPNFSLRETADGNATYDRIVTSTGGYSAPATQSSSTSFTALMITLKGK